MDVWREYFTQCGLELREPARGEDLAVAERELGVRFPPELRAVLLETNGVFDEHGYPVVCPCSDIVRVTREMWGEDDDPCYMTFSPHLYFGQEPNGDAYFFRVLNGEADTEIFAWFHEDDSRPNYAHNMRTYVTARVEEWRKEFNPEFDNATLDAFFDVLAFLALSTEPVVDSDAAVTQLESVAAALRAAPDDQQWSFAGRAQGLAAKETDPTRAEFFRNVSRDFGLFPEHG